MLILTFYVAVSAIIASRPLYEPLRAFADENSCIRGYFLRQLAVMITSSFFLHTSSTPVEIIKPTQQPSLLRVLQPPTNSTTQQRPINLLWDLVVFRRVSDSRNPNPTPPVDEAYRAILRCRHCEKMIPHQIFVRYFSLL